MGNVREPARHAAIQTTGPDEIRRAERKGSNRSFRLCLYRSGPKLWTVELALDLAGWKPALLDLRSGRVAVALKPRRAALAFVGREAYTTKCKMARILAQAVRYTARA